MVSKADHIKAVNRSRARLIPGGVKIIRTFLRKENARLIDSIGRPNSLHEAAARLKGNAREFYDPKDAYVKLYQSVVPVAARETEARLDKLKKGSEPIDFWLRFVLAWIESDAGRLIAGVAEFSHEMVVTLVNRQLSLAATEGWSVNRLTSAILSDLGTVAEYRARRIARTEIMRAYSVGSREAALQTGLVLKKVWLTAGDGRGERHATDLYPDLEGQTRDMNEYYDVGGYPAMTPQDAALPPGESCNCRCSEAYVPQ